MRPPAKGRTQAHACRMKLANERMKTEIKADDESSEVETVFCFCDRRPSCANYWRSAASIFARWPWPSSVTSSIQRNWTSCSRQQLEHYAASYATVISHEPGGTRTPGEARFLLRHQRCRETGSAGGSASPSHNDARFSYGAGSRRWMSCHWPRHSPWRRLRRSIIPSRRRNAAVQVVVAQEIRKKDEWLI